MSDELDKDELKKEDEKDEKELEAQETSTEEVKTKEEKKESAKEDKTQDIEAFKKALEIEIAERVRKEEKDKLYPSLEKYKADAKAAEEAKKVMEEKLKEYETSKLTVEEQAALKLEALEESNARLQAQMEELITEANNKITTLQLELYKKELLVQYGEEIIPSMISGNTIEEIQQSAENAHREYVAIRDRELAKLKEKPKGTIGTGISPQSDKLNAGVSVADINKITDPSEWEKVRDKFLGEALKQL